MNLVQLVIQEHQDNQVSPEYQGNQGNQAMTDKMESEDPKDILARKERWAHRDYLVYLDHRDLLVQMEYLEFQAKRASKDLLAIQVRRALWVHQELGPQGCQEQKERRAQLGIQERQGNPVQVEHQDIPVRKESVEFRVILVKKETWEHQEQDSRVRKEIEASKGIQGYQVNLE